MKLSNFKLVSVPHTGWKSLTPEVLKPHIIVAKAGTRVVCPKCKDVIGRLYSDLYSGVSCRADQIEFAQHQKRHRDQKAECVKCGQGYMEMRWSASAPIPRIWLHVELLPGRFQWI
jgi:uncharacterized protein (DUF983 family)